MFQATTNHLKLTNLNINNKLTSAPVCKVNECIENLFNFTKIKTMTDVRMRMFDFA